MHTNKISSRSGEQEQGDIVMQLQWLPNEPTDHKVRMVVVD